MIRSIDWDWLFDDQSLVERKRTMILLLLLVPSLTRMMKMMMMMMMMELMIDVQCYLLDWTNGFDWF